MSTPHTRLCTCPHSHVVHNAENHTKHQLEEAQNDGHLHLVAVGEGQLVFSYQPHLWRGVHMEEW